MASSDSVRSIRFSIQYSSIALLFYDYALTWTSEVEYMWFKKFKLSTALYLACRYAMVANILYTLALANKLPTLSCSTGYQICSALSVVGRAAIIFVWGMRTYVILNRNKYILLFLGPIGIAVICLNAAHVPLVVCVGSPGSPLAELFLAIFMVIFQVLSTSLSVLRTWQAWKVDNSGSSEMQRSRLNHLVFREGLFYSGCVSITTIWALILLRTAHQGSFIQRLLNALTLPISGLITARFLLHLRSLECQTSASPSEGDDSDPRGSLHFRHTREEGTMRSVMDEFGGDPVMRERNERRGRPDQNTTSLAGGERRAGRSP